MNGLQTNMFKKMVAINVVGSYHHLMITSDLLNIIWVPFRLVFGIFLRKDFFLERKFVNFFILLFAHNVHTKLCTENHYNMENVRNIFRDIHFLNKNLVWTWYLTYRFGLWIDVLKKWLSLLLLVHISVLYSLVPCWPLFEECRDSL